MYKTLSVFLIISSCLILFSCQKNDKQAKLIKYYPKENKIVEFSYLLKGNDTIIDGEVTYYSKDRKIILGKAYYKNGLLNGRYTGYYTDGKIKQIVNYRNDTIVGDRVYNYSDGNIERYILHDDSGRVAFIVKFDNNGNVIKRQGFPLVDVENIGKKTLDSLKLGDSLKYSYYLANIPTSKCSFIIKSLNFDDKKNQRRISSRKNCRITVDEKVNRVGKNSIIAKLKFEFSDSNKTIIVDSLRFDYYVK